MNSNNYSLARLGIELEFIQLLCDHDLYHSFKPGVGNLFIPCATPRSSKVPAGHYHSIGQKKALRRKIRHFTADSIVFLSLAARLSKNVVLGQLRYPLSTYVIVPGLALVTTPSLSSLSIIYSNNISRRYISYILCVCR